MQQIPLGWRWPAQQRFDTFHIADNGVAAQAIEQAALQTGAPWVFLHGAEGSGKTHLLIAACHAATDAGASAQYVALRNLAEPRATVLRGFGGSDLLVLDDVDALAGSADLQHALFDLFNRCRAEGSTLVFSGPAPATQLGFDLPDLVSRLSSCTQVLLNPLNDEQRREVLRARGEARGVVLGDAVLDFLFQRYARDLGSLGILLDRLDRESLAAKRRVTVPFLRELLSREM
ncbi:MAG: DnaA regulatory inactivator Hda [Tahibacter sp.]